VLVGITLVLNTDRIGWVIIGRNEGERLVRCFKSFAAVAKVYVDSGSTDQSLLHGQDLGFDCITLDLAQPFTAARARNEGWKRLLMAHPLIEYVMFVDGDCEVAPGWVEAALAHLDSHVETAVVCGQRKERFPNASIYNLLCDIEWNTPVGPAKACGGDALFRVKALLETNGYRNDLIAGEEPELCLRIRALGWAVVRIDQLMTIHDASLSEFRQWWNRALRGGYAFAAVWWIHRHGAETLWSNEVAKIGFWGLLLPCVILGTVPLFGAKALFLLLIYPLQALRLGHRMRAEPGPSITRGVFLVLAKFAETAGALKFCTDLLRRKQSTIIEYK
jgi:GT2 family glycosyltransferase